MTKNLMILIVVFCVIGFDVIGGENFILSGGEDENFFLPDNKIMIEISIKNFNKNQIPRAADIEIKDYLEQCVYKNKLEILQETIKHEINLSKFGTFIIEVKYLDGDGKILKEEKNTFARIRDVRLTKPNKKSRFGIGAYYAVRFEPKKARQAAKIQSMLGAAWNRDELLWDIGEPEKGKWDFSKYDMAVEVSHDNNILILGLVDYWGKWAKKHTDEGRKDYANYAATLVRRYKPDGEFAKIKGWKDGYGITHWEIWNEPATFWDGTANDFGLLYKEVFDAIKKEDKNAIVFFSNIDEKFDDEVIKITGAERITGITPHYYCPPKSPEAGKIDIGMNKTVKWYRDKNINSPLFSSEFGWNSTNEILSMQNQAYYLIRAFVFGFASGHDTMISYNFFNDSLDKNNIGTGFGIMNREDFTPKLSYGTYAAAVYFMEGCSNPERVDFLPEIRCYVYKTDKFPAAAILWSSGAEGCLNLKPKKGLTLFDVMGNELDDKFSDTGAIPLRKDHVFLVADKNNEANIANPKQLGEYLLSGEVKGISSVNLNISQIYGSLKNNPPLNLRIENNSKKTLKGKVKVFPPANWILKHDEIDIGEIQSKSSGDIKIEFTKMGDNPENIYPIKIILTTADEAKCEYETTLNELIATYGTPKIDGDLSDWKNAKPIYLNDSSQAVGLIPYMDWNLSAEIKTMWDEENFYFAATVTDNVYFQPHTGSLVWEGDNFQLGFYTDVLKNEKKEGFVSDKTKSFLYGISKTKNGTEAWRWVGGEPAESEIKDIKISFSNPSKDKYIYEAAIPKSRLPGINYQDGSCFMFSFILNDNDGGGRRGWLEWTTGIGTGFNPTYYTVWCLTK